MLLIDRHEPDAIIKKLEPLPVRVVTLKYGDYSFSDTIIERKTLSDFFSSLKSNRLKEQMEYISRYYTEKFLLIEGFFDFSYINNIDYLYSELADIALNFNINLIFSKDMAQTADIIKRAYRQRNFGYPLNIQKKDNVYHAAKFFGVSNKKLEILFSKFGNIRNMVNADKKEFKGLKSVGKKTIEKVKNTLETDIFN